MSSVNLFHEFVSFVLGGIDLKELEKFHPIFSMSGIQKKSYMESDKSFLFTQKNKRTGHSIYSWRMNNWYHWYPSNQRGIVLKSSKQTFRWYFWDWSWNSRRCRVATTSWRQANLFQGSELKLARVVPHAANTRSNSRCPFARQLFPQLVWFHFFMWGNPFKCWLFWNSSYVTVIVKEVLLCDCVI